MTRAATSNDPTSVTNSESNSQSGQAAVATRRCANLRWHQLGTVASGCRSTINACWVRHVRLIDALRRQAVAACAHRRLRRQLISNAWPGLLDHQAWITPASGVKGGRVTPSSD